MVADYINAVSIGKDTLTIMIFCIICLQVIESSCMYIKCLQVSYSSYKNTKWFGIITTYPKSRCALSP